MPAAARRAASEPALRRLAWPVRVPAGHGRAFRLAPRGAAVAHARLIRRLRCSAGGDAGARALAHIELFAAGRAAMPGGFGTSATGPRGPAIVSRLPAPHTVGEMARGAIVAVEQLAAANGHPISTANLGGGGAGHHRASTPVLVIFAPVLLLALAFAGRSLLSRRRRGPAAKRPDGG